MRIVAMHSHLNGHEWLLVHENRIWKEIEATVQAVDASRLKTKISKEKTMRGKRLFSPKELNKDLRNCSKQWHGAMAMEQHQPPGKTRRSETRRLTKAAMRSCRGSTRAIASGEISSLDRMVSRLLARSHLQVIGPFVQSFE